MRSTGLVVILTFIIVGGLLGCAGGSGPSIPPAQNSQTTASAEPGGADSPHYLWGYYSLIFDASAGTADIVPLRSSELHVNVVRFLESGKLYIALENLKIVSGVIDVDVKLTHPFPGMATYTGFDVRGIFISPGTVSGYSDTGIVHADPAKTYLVNADGWTRWWNPSEFPVGDSIFGYRNGKLGNLYNGSNLNATLNAYKYFCDDLKIDDTLDMLNKSHRGMFQSGSTNGRHYQIHFDTSKPLVYNYAVDASWLPPNPDPPIAVPGDFPPSANMPEPYRISVSITENDLFFVDNTNKGGHAHVKADVYDWGGCKYDTLKADTTFGLTIDVTDPPTGTGDELSTYEFDLDGNDLSSSGNVTALISATANDATYGLGTISAKNVATYVFLTIPVSGIATPPTVTGIDPNHYEIKKTLVGAVVTGTSFASNAHVSLIKDGATNPVIDAVNEVVAGGNSITCDIPLTDPGVLPGKYDVRVTNPGTGLYGELDKGFTVDDVNAPWPGWMAGGLNEAASKFVGYGSTGAPTAPKWVYSNTSYGGPAAGCAIGKDGTIYLCTSGQGTGPYVALHAVNPDGSLKWIFSKSGACWISFCPAIDKDGYIYVCEGTPSVNYLYKVDPASHTEVWSCNLGSTACYTTAPAIGLDGAVYVAYCGAQPGYIRRVEPDGTLGWGYWIPSAFSPSLSWQLGMAVLPGGDIVAAAGTHGRIIRFHPDGSTVWLYQYSWWTLETPSVGPEGNVYFTTYDGGGLVELDSGGNFQWEYPTGYFLWASPVVDPVTGHIFFGDRLGKFRCFDNAKNMLWTHDFGATHIDGTAAVDANGDVYCAVGNQPSQPYIGLVKMSGTDGSIIWQSDMFDDMITTAPAIGPDGTVYLPGYDNQHLLLAYGN